jgi:plasmid stabilization system protein ParE
MNVYRLSRKAEADLRSIAEYLDREAGPQVAERVLTEVLKTIIRLADHPHSGRTSEAYGPGVRKFFCDPYVIYYRARRQGIEVAHVFHGARDQQSAWLGKKASKGEVE